MQAFSTSCFLFDSFGVVTNVSTASTLVRLLVAEISVFLLTSEAFGVGLFTIWSLDFLDIFSDVLLILSLVFPFLLQVSTSFSVGLGLVTIALNFVCVAVSDATPTLSVSFPSPFKYCLEVADCLSLENAVSAVSGLSLSFCVLSSGAAVLILLLGAKMLQFSVFGCCLESNDEVVETLGIKSAELKPFFSIGLSCVGLVVFNVFISLSLLRGLFATLHLLLFGLLWSFSAVWMRRGLMSVALFISCFVSILFTSMSS